MDNFIQWITDKNITLIISIIGCLTGIGGLSINFYKFHTERFHLKVELEKNAGLFFKKISEKELRWTKYQALVSMNLINRSSSPVTIYDLILVTNGSKHRIGHYEGEEIILPDGYLNPKRKEQKSIDMSYQLVLPLRIEAFDVKSVVAFFPYFPDPKDQPITSFKLKFKTAKGNRSKRLSMRLYQ